MRAGMFGHRDWRLRTAQPSCSQLLGHPVRSLQSPAISTIVGDMVAVLDRKELDGTLHFASKTLGVAPWHDCVLLAGHDEEDR